jgi:hypothetical protein
MEIHRLIKQHFMMTCWESGGIAPHTFLSPELDEGGSHLVIFIPRTLYPRGKSPKYPWYKRIGRPLSRFERDSKDETNISDASTGNRTRNMQLVH